jgi:hypothetical protein
MQMCKMVDTLVSCHNAGSLKSVAIDFFKYSLTTKKVLLLWELHKNLHFCFRFDGHEYWPVGILYGNIDHLILTYYVWNINSWKYGNSMKVWCYNYQALCSWNLNWWILKHRNDKFSKNEMPGSIRQWTFIALVKKTSLHFDCLKTTDGLAQVRNNMTWPAWALV